MFELGLERGRDWIVLPIRIGNEDLKRMRKGLRTVDEVRKMVDALCAIHQFSQPQTLHSPDQILLTTTRGKSTRR